MSKRTMAKIQKRAKAKREKTASSAQRKSANTRALKLMKEGLEQESAKGFAATWSVPERDDEELWMLEPRNAFQEPPRFVGEFRRRLDTAGATAAINAFASSMGFATFSALGNCPPGLAMLCPGLEGDPARVLSLPGFLLYCTQNPAEWLHREFKDEWVGLVAWLTWTHAPKRNPLPTVIAMDRNGRLAVWFLDEDNAWHPASQASRFLAFHGRGVVEAPDDEGLHQLFAFCGVSDPDETSPTRASDPAVVRAVDIAQSVQQQLVDGVVHLAMRYEKSDKLVDRLIARLDEMDAMYDQITRLERKLAKAERERESAREAFATAQKSAQVAAAPIAVQTLQERLAKIFG
jgi:hypothetical protein